MLSLLLIGVCMRKPRVYGDFIEQINKKIPNSFKVWDLYFKIASYGNDYNSNAFLGLPPIKISVGFSSASFTATKKPTDSRPSIIR